MGTGVEIALLPGGLTPDCFRVWPLVVSAGKLGGEGSAIEKKTRYNASTLPCSGSGESTMAAWQPAHPEIPKNFRFEFDSENKILLLRVEGRLTDKLLAELYVSIRKYSTATDARAGIWDLSSVTEFAISNDLIRSLASQEPAMPDAARRPRIIAVVGAVGFGLARMFQILGESTRPLLKVVHNRDEALAELGVQSPHFEPLE